MMRHLAAAAGALLLAACVSSGPSKAPTNTKEAARANVQLGVAYMQQGNLQLAREKLLRAEQQDPRSVELQMAMAFLNERLGRPEEAERHYRTAQRLAPRSADVANNYAVFLCTAGRADQALPLFETAARDPLYRTPWAALTNAAVCLRSARRNADAVALLERAIALRPDFSEAVMQLADVQLELGNADQAAAVVNRYLGIGRSSPDVLLVGVRAAIARGDRPATDEYARRLRRDYPDSTQTSMLPQLLRAP
ncbi:MAG: type IV pilus biogenesis/stability protein PilW [Steroidobacteraceae bacterium]